MKRSARAWAVIAAVLVLVAAAWWLGLVRQNYGVALTSRSMSHADEDLDGVLDPGEQVSVVPVFRREDVVTAVEARERGVRVGDDWGDVISFTTTRAGREIGVVHRALVWVEWDDASQAYDAPSLGLDDVRTLVIPDVGTWNPSTGQYERSDHVVLLDPDVAGRKSGFVTKGDHNAPSDQDARVVPDDRTPLVDVASITGKVAGFLEPRDTMRLAAWALGGALALSLGAAAARRSGIVARIKTRAGACPTCGRRVAPHAAFCPACGADRP